MRKQDRMKGGQQQTDQSRQSSESDQQTDECPREEMRGSASEESKKPGTAARQKAPASRLASWADRDQKAQIR